MADHKPGHERWIVQRRHCSADGRIPVAGETMLSHGRLIFLAYTTSLGTTVRQRRLSLRCLGDSLHIYNDDGGLGGFGEVEARGRTTGYGTERTTSTDEFASWWFFGPSPLIDDVAGHLLGVGLNELEHTHG